MIVLASLVEAQRAEARQRGEVERRRATEVVALARAQFAGDADDAVLGISTTSSGERDTLGLLVTSVTPDSPADKAGIEEGNRIASVNGVNLKLAAEDAGERDMHGMTTRRLIREMEKVEPGQSVELSIWKQGRYQPVTVQTVAREDLPGQERITREEADERAVVGLTLQTTGSIRDTLGPMVVRVAAGGPAERAGIVEGDRIRSVNGTSLRVAPEDAEEPMVGSAKVNRFSRELRDLDVGATVELEVYSGGQVRTLRVTTAKADEVYGEESGGMFFYRSGEGGWSLPAMAPVPPVPPVPPMPFSGRLEVRRLAPTVIPGGVQVWRRGGVI
jgi:C-terminal processing protease CtpA/Prc